MTTVKECKKGDDKVCKDLFATLCCASITAKKIGTDETTLAVYKALGWPLKENENKYLCAGPVASLATYKDNLSEETKGFQYKVYCDAAQMVKATLLAASAAFAASSF